MGAFAYWNRYDFRQEKPTRFYQAIISMLAFDFEHAQKYARLKSKVIQFLSAGNNGMSNKQKKYF